MGRKTHNHVAEPKTLVEGAEVEQETRNYKMDLQPEPAKPGSVERIEPKPSSVVAKYSSKKGKRKDLGGVRRSERLQNAVTVTSTHPDMDVQRVIEEITLSESETAGEEGGEEGFLETIVNGKNLEENIGCMNGLNSKGIKRGVVGRSDAAVEGELTYKNLYIESQKKVEALMDEKRQLALNLEHARGQIEVYEKQSRSVIEVLDKLKDVVVMSSLTKATQAAMNLSSEAVLGTFVGQGNGHDGKTPVKRKRNDK